VLRAVGRFLAEQLGFAELKEGYRTLGSPRFFAVLISILAYCLAYAWLVADAEWPGRCDHEGRRLLGLLKQMRCSPDLLQGGATEIALFAMLWLMPAVVAAALIWRLAYEIRRRRNRFEEG
jgi:hypothetical protein